MIVNHLRQMGTEECPAPDGVVDVLRGTEVRRAAFRGPVRDAALPGPGVARVVHHLCAGLHEAVGHLGVRGRPVSGVPPGEGQRGDPPAGRPRKRVFGPDRCVRKEGRWAPCGKLAMDLLVVASNWSLATISIAQQSLVVTGDQSLRPQTI